MYRSDPKFIKLFSLNKVITIKFCYHSFVGNIKTHQPKGRPKPIILA